MHTIKGSSAMMSYGNISLLAHSMEDMFYYLREESNKNFNYSSLSDLVLESVDFIKAQVEKIKNGSATDDDASRLIANNRDFLSELQEPKQHQYTNSYKAVIRFKEGSEMENIRAFNVLHNLKEIVGEIRHIPEDIMSPGASEIIRSNGFIIYFKSDYFYVDIHQLLMQTVFLKELELEELEEEEALNISPDTVEESQEAQQPLQNKSEQQAGVNQEGIHPDSIQHCIHQQNVQQQSIISVPVTKLDLLMNLMGEFVIAEAMVTLNPDIKELKKDNFQKAVRQLNKITGELQDVVMSIRMVPLSATFHKMNRIVRDMSKKLNKNVELKIIGEETEVDKNIIEHMLIY